MKFLILGLLVFVFYRLVFKPKALDPGPKNPPIKEKEDEGFVDYEEIE
jgi:hypothetical protein